MTGNGSDVGFTCVALHWLQRCCVSAQRHDQVYRDDEQLWIIMSVHGYRMSCYWRPVGLLGHIESSELQEVSDQIFPVLNTASWTGLGAVNLS